jgi:hypothetical protein
MVYAAIGGQQLKRWTGYFKIILPTLKVFKAAKNTDGCVHADTFKDGNVFFAVSVWESREKMQAFAKAGLHGDLAGLAMDHMAMFFNHTEEFDTVPDRQACVAAWKAAITARDGKGTVGHYQS